MRGTLPKSLFTPAHLHPDDQPATNPVLHLIRPLLDISRAEIDAYCQEHQLAPRYDHTNQDTAIFRNRLRHELIPYLESHYNPNLRQTLQRTAKITAADPALLKQQVSAVWPTIVRREQSQQIIFDRELWLALPLAWLPKAYRPPASLPHVINAWACRWP